MAHRIDTPDDALIETIIAMECAALDRWGNGDPSGFLEICAPDVVYFDPNLERRIDGRDALSEYYDAIKGKVSIERYELLNPLVQLVGDAFARDEEKRLALVDDARIDLHRRREISARRPLVHQALVGIDHACRPY